jgi:hypothetical protein
MIICSPVALLVNVNIFVHLCHWQQKLVPPHVFQAKEWLNITAPIKKNEVVKARSQMMRDTYTII